MLIPEAEDLFDGTLTREDFITRGATFVDHYLIGRCNLKPHESVLDIGSGNGQKARPLTKYLNETGSYVGLDIVKDAIDWCNERYHKWNNFRFDFADINSDWYNSSASSRPEDYVFPYQSDSFDLAFMSSVTTHLLPPAMKNYLKETSRVLKPGGRLLVTFFLISAERKARQLPPVLNRDFKQQDLNHWVLDETSPSLAVSYAESFVREAFSEAGLDVVEITFGTWGGNEDMVGAYQDTIMAVKPKHFKSL